MGRLRTAGGHLDNGQELPPGPSSQPGRCSPSVEVTQRFLVNPRIMVIMIPVGFCILLSFISVIASWASRMLGGTGMWVKGRSPGLNIFWTSEHLQEQLTVPRSGSIPQAPVGCDPKLKLIIIFGTSTKQHRCSTLPRMFGMKSS